jgi:hypothetical protein
MAARRSSSPTDYEAFEVGDQVRHPKWGVGSILFKSGSGESTKAIVVFPEQGQKKLLLKFAKLERVSETVEAEEDEFGIQEEAPKFKAPPAPSKRAAPAAAEEEEEEETAEAVIPGLDDEEEGWEEKEEEEEVKDTKDEEEF